MALRTPRGRYRLTDFHGGFVKLNLVAIVSEICVKPTNHYSPFGKESAGDAPIHLFFAGGGVTLAPIQSYPNSLSPPAATAPRPSPSSFNFFYSLTTQPPPSVGGEQSTEASNSSWAPTVSLLLRV